MYSINVFARNFIILHFTILSVFVYKTKKMMNGCVKKYYFLFLIVILDIGIIF